MFLLSSHGALTFGALLSSCEDTQTSSYKDRQHQDRSFVFLPALSPVVAQHESTSRTNITPGDCSSSHCAIPSVQNFRSMDQTSESRSKSSLVCLVQILPPQKMSLTQLLYSKVFCHTVLRVVYYPAKHENVS